MGSFPLPPQRKSPHPFARMGTFNAVCAPELLLNGSGNGANAGASAAADASICIDNELAVTLSDSLYGALSCTCTTSDALVRNLKCHCSHLTL